MVKMFVRNEQLPEILGEVKSGAFLKIKGVTTIDKFDGELTIGSVTGIRKIADFTESRQDTAPEKRVELHCHTKMSDMDGVTDAAALVKAYRRCQRFLNGRMTGGIKPLRLPIMVSCRDSRTLIILLRDSPLMILLRLYTEWKDI